MRVSGTLRNLYCAQTDTKCAAGRRREDGWRLGVHRRARLSAAIAAARGRLISPCSAAPRPLILAAGGETRLVGIPLGCDYAGLLEALERITAPVSESSGATPGYVSRNHVLCRPRRAAVRRRLGCAEPARRALVQLLLHAAQHPCRAAPLHGRASGKQALVLPAAATLRRRPWSSTVCPPTPASGWTWWTPRMCRCQPPSPCQSFKWKKLRVPAGEAFEGRRLFLHTHVARCASQPLGILPCPSPRPHPCSSCLTSGWSSAGASAPTPRCTSLCSGAAGRSRSRRRAMWVEGSGGQ